MTESDQKSNRNEESRRQEEEEEERLQEPDTGKKTSLSVKEDLEKSKSALEKSYRFNEIISQLSKIFIKTTHESFNDDINYMLSLTGSFFQVDRSYLFLFSGNCQTMTNTHEWCAEGISPQMLKIQKVPTDSLPWLKFRILSGKAVHIPDVEKLPVEAAAEKTAFVEQDIKSLICMPVAGSDHIRGFLGFDAVTNHYSWSDQETDTLWVLTNIVSHLLLRLDNEKRLREHTGMLKTLVDISSGFINIPPDKTDDIIMESLRAICLLVDADRSYVFSYDFSRQTASNTYEWCRDGIEPQIEYLQNNPLELIPDWVKNHRANLINYIPDVMALPPESNIRQLLESQGIKSIISVPLMHGDTCIGFVGFDSVRKHHNYTDKEQGILNIFSLLLINLHKRNESNLELTRAKGYAEQSEKRLQLIAENISEVVWLRSADNSRMLYINPAYEKIWGRTCESLYKNPESFIDSVYDPDKPGVFAAFKKSLRTNTFDEVYRIIRSDGKIRWIHSRSFPVINSNGDIIKHTGIAVDITERKKAEEAVRKTNMKLQAAVSNARSLAQKAEAANRAKSLFISNMSHELRTPLNAVIGFSQLLSRDPLLSARQRGDVAVIQRSGNDLMKIINDILDIAKIESGRAVANETDFSLAGLLDDIVAVFDSRCKGKELRLMVERGPGLPDFLYGDGGKLKQIMVNLLSNAVKYTCKGGIALCIRSESHPAEKGVNTRKYRLTMEVEDSGIGITEDDLSRIFQPFERVEDSGNIEGTGLGLVICREYAALLGGDIRVTSNKGQGSCFSFTVVMKKGRPVSTEKEPVHPRVTGLHPAYGPVRILVADDDPDNQTLLNALLTPAGFEVARAMDGTEALALFDRFDPHAVFMDMRMPKMDGYEATRQLKNTPKGRSIPVIALTASAFEDGRKRIQQAGVDAYIRKPFQDREIFDVLERCLGLQYEYQDSRRQTPAPAVTQQVLSLLPADLRRSLVQAVEAGNMARFFELINPLKESHPDLAAGLAHLAENFDYARILSLLTQDGKDDRL